MRPMRPKPLIATRTLAMEKAPSEQQENGNRARRASRLGPDNKRSILGVIGASCKVRENCRKRDEEGPVPLVRRQRNGSDPGQLRMTGRLWDLGARGFVCAFE